MKLAGIICEYNPFHNGHALHIDETRRLTGEDCAIVAVMSGDYTQRGEPAVFTARARAAAALEKADLVLELPIFASTASAEVFAGGGLAVLDAIGANFISFGSESGDLEALSRVARCLFTEDFVYALKPELDKGASFAAARQRAVETLLGEDAKLLSNPNDILAVEYLKAIAYSGAEIKPIAIKRAGSDHDRPGLDAGAAPGALASASALREALLSGGDISPFVPAAAMEAYRAEMAAGRGPVSFKSAEQSLFYRLRTMSDGEYARLPYASEGLHLKLQKAALECDSASDLIAAVKSKRYPESGIRRMLLYAWLGSDFAAARLSYIRVLGFNERGREALREIGPRCRKPLLVKPASVKELDGEAQAELAFRARAASLYALLFPGGGEYNIYKETPLHP